MKPTKQNTMEAIYLQSSLQFGETLKSVSDSDYRRLRDNYDVLLKQPLKLGFFVPCDENGNVLEEPKRWNDYLQFPDSFDGNKEWGELYNYELAKEKVLFENSVLIDKTPFKQTKRMLINLNHPATFRIYNKFNYSDGSIQSDFLPNFSEIPTIEYLVSFNLQLTPTAIKQIGL